MNMNIKTKLTYGIGLLFVLITLLGGLAIKNIHNVSDDTQNILADNYNSLLYSRQMLESLDAIRENPNARKEFEAGLEAQKKNLTEKDEDVLTNRLSSNCEKALDDMDDESIRQIRQTIYTIMAVNMSAIYEKNEVAVHTAERSLFWIWTVGIACIVIAFLFLALVCPRRRGRAKLPRAAAVLLWVLTLGYSFAFFKTDMLPDLGIYTQQWVTQRNGFALNFTVALRYSSVEKPDGYSHDAVLKLKDQYQGRDGDEARQPVNLIVIMNESFSDLTIFDGLDPSEDPTPFLHSLTENTVKGWMYSPVTGGGTASVEFEYLTGFSTLFQPPHTVAYQLYVKEDMPSLAALAGSAGYDTTAFHPYKSSGWNRPIAYQDLGFDHQLYEEDVEDPYLIRHYISDRSDYETVMETTRSANAAGQKCFVFNVTMQNHSGYSQGWNNLERTIDLPDQLKNADSSAIQYLALARASDDALKQLIEYYSQVNPLWWCSSATTSRR